MKWISVKDRLPALLQDVLIKTEKCIDVARLLRFQKISFETRDPVGPHFFRWEPNHLLDDRDEFHEFHEVTHWMLLPEPPKDEK